MARGIFAGPAIRRFGAISFGSLIMLPSAFPPGSEALAGGLSVREQSVFSQGASFAGAAAGGDLSSSFWNPAAMATAGYGLATESHFSLIVADIDVRAESVSVLPGSLMAPSTTAVNDVSKIDPIAAVAASYASWRVNDEFVLGLSISAPFGSQNDASDPAWSGQYHYRASQLLTVNINPIVSYQISPTLAIGAGPQIQYMLLKLKANPSGALAPPQRRSIVEGDDIGVGYTAGLLWQPTPATSIGLGFRSAVSHNIEGDASMRGGMLATGVGLGTVAFEPVDFSAKLETPEMVTLSARQSVTSTTRLLATVEWTNWSRLDEVNFMATRMGGIAARPFSPGDSVNILDFHWDDGWFFALGGEWDYSSRLTLRAGAAYEVSPIRNATQRKINVADSDRIWLSAGASYAATESMSFDVAYSHIIFDDAPIDALTNSPASPTTPVRRFVGRAHQSADIVSVAMKSKW